MLDPESHNATPPDHCTRQHSDDPGRCLFAEHLVPLIRQPVFLSGSLYDAWSWTNDFGEPCPHYDQPGSNGSHPFCSTPEGWITTNCECTNTSTTDVASVSSSVIARLNKFAAAFSKKLHNVLDVQKDGAFIDSCMGHAKEYSNYPGIKIGGLGATAALTNWLTVQLQLVPEDRNNIRIEAKQSRHVHIDCLWSNVPPYGCNPACVAADPHHTGNSSSSLVKFV